MRRPAFASTAKMAPQQRSSLCPRRPQRKHLPLACVPAPQPDTLRTRLEHLLNSLPRYAERVSEEASDAVESLPERVRHLFSRDGPFGALQFWREHEKDIKKTTTDLIDTGEAAVRRDAERVKRGVLGLDFRWLFRRPVEQEEIEPALEPVTRSKTKFNLEKQVKNIALFALDALTPWDFDRHDFGLTFVNVWEDVDTHTGGPDAAPAVVKMTSTIKPLFGEWKLSARSKLLELPEGAVVFGKAGLYLAGERPAYVGVEADRVWKVAGLKGTKIYVNVNYRSSRKPDVDPIKTSLGVQQDFEMWNGITLTIRVGLDPLQRDKILITPVPNGSYF